MCAHVHMHVHMPACMCVHGLQVIPPGAGLHNPAVVSCWAWAWAWELNVGPLHEQCTLLTTQLSVCAPPQPVLKQCRKGK